MIVSEDAGIKGQGESDWRPVVGVPWDPSPGVCFHVLVEGSRDDLNDPIVDESVDGVVQ